MVDECGLCLSTGAVCIRLQDTTHGACIKCHLKKLPCDYATEEWNAKWSEHQQKMEEVQQEATKVKHLPDIRSILVDLEWRLVVFYACERNAVRTEIQQLCWFVLHEKNMFRTVRCGVLMNGRLDTGSSTDDVYRQEDVANRTKML
eukprot:TRINITY_DN64323_c0_g1_i2.p1 TRINITY_DN64323_c0_g1~~TRINITY_DN64323_c0_g1_i2.p1  ORF type:complete len:146 (-),score=9.91 TRINITY_DN64323_c0_g1_i2:86-523(-)